ncbi:MAG: hypothetical protein CL916_07920, partial [Deltaproteobacteria bacterium]|nr:hypothetical protein [Deltaproteobacteria bacterium]
VFNFFEPQTLLFFGKAYQIGPELLLDIPDTIKDSIMHPNFGKINTVEFWITVFTILIITSIESLAIAKAVDKIDPYKRKTDLNKDLTGIGLSTIVAGMIGGLPIIAVIIRSTVNIHNGAKTKWSNMYQGLLLLLFIVVLSPIMRQVPLCAFAILLVYTGFKLASPAVFKKAYNEGTEQLIFFVGTMVLTLYTNLLFGLIGGLLLALVTHMLLARVSISQFFKMVYNPGTELIKNSDGTFLLKVRGIANFLGILKVDKLFANIPSGADVNIDLSETRLVGITYMDYLVEFLKTQTISGGEVIITGLDYHISSSTHHRALNIRLKGSDDKLLLRQQRLQDLATDKDYHYNSTIDWNTISLKRFYFFEIRPIECKYNCLKGTFKELGISWEIADITFNQGDAFTSETFNTTMMLIKLNTNIPIFSMEKESGFEQIFDRLMALTGHKDFDFEKHPDFSKKFLLMGDDETEIRSFFTDEIIRFFENKHIYHLESNGKDLIIFDQIKLARTDETIALIDYGKELTTLLMKDQDLVKPPTTV